jgi:hypothetical protein
MSEWISIEERLPILEHKIGVLKKSNLLLLVTETENITIGYRSVIKFGESEKGNYIDQRGNIIKITHWMPLPNLPL